MSPKSLFTHIDAGTKYIFIDALNRPTEARDAKGSLVLSAYDTLSRPVNVWCRDQPGEDVLLRSKTVYGDDPSVTSPADKNALGKPYQIYDEAGLTTMNQYDFKGNPMEKTREVISDAKILEVFDVIPIRCYRVNWDAVVPLEGNYVTSMQYDALNRARSITYPQDVDGQRKILLPAYNKGGALTKVDLKDTALSSPVNYVERIAYNAKGQQLLVAYGNGMMTRFLYRADNFRLLRLKSEKYIKSGLTYTGNSGVKQNYSYEYDLSGNIINITDTTPSCGYGATPDVLSRDFMYDALYRLLSATGRETAATGTTPWDDLYRPQNESLARGYRQLYDYDKLGNIKELQHVATSGNFTRTFGYDPLLTNNALQKITIGSNEYDFSYDVNGNMLSEGDTARHLEYDCADRLRAFYIQTPLAEPSKYTHYLYDGSGNRVKKLTRKQGGGYTVTTYIDGAFEYTKESGVGEQNILHVMGGATRRIGADLGDSTPAIKYNLADQLGSSCVQLDTNGTTVSLEEYYPFGETSFGSYAKKRYRFCGKEKDEESGLYYYGARYYSAWTCRFISIDPMAGKYPMKTPYHYCSNNPINKTDPTGMDDGGGDSTKKTSGGSTPAPTPSKNSNGTPVSNNTAAKTTTSNSTNSLYVAPNATTKTNTYQQSERLPFYHQQGGNMGTDLADTYKKPTPTLEQIKASEPEKVNIKINSPVLTVTKKPTTVLEVHAAKENQTNMYWDQVRSSPYSIYNKSNYFKTDMQLARAAGEGLVMGVEAAAGELAVSKFADFYKMYKIARTGEIAVETTPVIVETPVIAESINIAEDAGQAFHSFSALKRSLGPAGEGQAWHHIVEQNPANIAQFGQEALQNMTNVIRLPHGAGTIHARVSGYYSSIQPTVTGSSTMTVRQWLSTKSYQFQYDFGIQKLKDFGWQF